jgi:peptide chain release factor 2
MSTTYQPGEEAGIKSATFSRDWTSTRSDMLSSEIGVHRLVREFRPSIRQKRRHTSFASVYVSPEIDDSIEVNIKPDDIRIDTYRSERQGRAAREYDRFSGADHALFQPGSW